MLHGPPPPQPVIEERLNFILRDQSAVSLLVCRAGFEHCALMKLCSMAVGLDTSAERSKTDVGWPKGRVPIWSVLFLNKSWSLVDLNYWKLYLLPFSFWYFICLQSVNALQTSITWQRGSLSGELQRAPQALKDVVINMSLFKTVVLLYLSDTFWWMVSLKAIKDISLVSMLQLDICGCRILPAHWSGVKVCSHQPKKKKKDCLFLETKICLSKS